MKLAKFSAFGMLVLSLFLVGCGGGSTSSSTTTPPKGEKVDKKTDKNDKGVKKDDEDDHHDHGEGPHGGTIIEFGKYHAEFTVSHPKKEVTIYILSGNLKKAVPIDAKELLLSIKNPNFQIKLTPSPLEGEAKGTSSRFVGTDDKFGKEQEFEGTLSGEIEGKPYAGDFKEKPEEKKK
jgi:hypothetical protein